VLDTDDFRRLGEAPFPAFALVPDFVDFADDLEDLVLDEADFLPEPDALDFDCVAPDAFRAVLFFAVDELEDERLVDPFDAGFDFELDDFAELDDFPDPDFERVDFFAVGIFIPPISKLV
jgi:hypothetical protein